MKEGDIILVASGDSRLPANRVCWPAQQALEAAVVRAFADLGRTVVRGHAPDPELGHGFIDGQARGIEVFRGIDPDAPLVVAEAVWQYTSHVLAGLTKHRGPILTLANWSGQWPGLVGLLNLNGSLTKAGIRYSSIWSEQFTDPFARRAIAEWLQAGTITHDRSHARPLADDSFDAKYSADCRHGAALGEALVRDQAILGVFDEGCMGMYNAIIPDHLLHGLGLFKERLSQSALYAAMRQVNDSQARAHYEWLRERGMRFVTGSDEATELTERQVLEGLKMYDAAVQLAHGFGCAAIGIQYQQGLKDTCVASDLAEGLLNNPDRPPVTGEDGRVLFEGLAVPHFNEVDECAGVDALITNRVWRDLKLDPSTTLHDVRWGADVNENGVSEFVWVFEISGAAPASHFIGGYAGAVGERQPPMYFPRGGSTLKGVSRPGELVWSRIYVAADALHMDIGRGGVVKLTEEETNRRWQATTPCWPIMHAVLYGVSRDQLMAKHQANHIQVAYAKDAASGMKALVRKAAMARAMGISVHLCGDITDSLDRHQAAEFRGEARGPDPAVTVLLEARGVGKDFPAVRALADVDFELRAGEVHALIGENGAGKSTLVRILSGEIADYGGCVALNGVEQRFDSPRAALAAGIAVIPQELQLVTSLTVAENVYLGREPRGAAGLVDRVALNRVVRAELDAMGAQHVAADAPLASLDAANRQLVAIARALSLDARCIIMDEPTASLGTAEARQLGAVIARLVAGGAGVLYVSHKLDEVRRLAHRVTVLRDGARVITRAAEGLTEDEMVRLMVGRQIERTTLAPVPATAAELLRVERLSLPDPALPGGYRLRDVSFAVHAGEIVGLAGLVGAGRTDLLLALVGGSARQVEGRIRLDGRDYVPATPAEARDAGLVMLPEERKASGIFPNLSVSANVSISALGRVSARGVLSRKRERDDVARLLGDAGVRAASPSVAMGTLSGGNQQKALLARCLYASPRVLLLDEPTRGIDLAAKAEVYAGLRALAARGFGVVLCSSEMSEVLTQCHRVLVFREGRVTAAFDREEATEEKVLAAAAGTPLAPPDAPPPRRGAPRWRDRASRHAGLFGLAAVLLLAIVTSPVRGGHLVFLDIGNLTDILRQVSEKGILAVGMTAVVISGGIDLSVGSLLAFGATLSGWLWMRQGVGLAAAAGLTVALTALWGLLNGVVIARWRLPAFIATLASMSAARGAARYLSGGTAIPLGFGEGGAPLSVQRIAGPLFPYVPVPAVIFGLTAVAMYFFLARTRGGRYIYAIGDNEAAARLAGVRVGWHKASVYVMSAALAGLAGLVHCAQLQQGNPNDGVAYELDAIAAVVIGGTSLSGGTGTVGGTIVGILIIGVINNSMGLNNVDANLQLILKGIIILVAVWLQRR